jgi:hypothetical protein
MAPLTRHWLLSADQVVDRTSGCCATK